MFAKPALTISASMGIVDLYAELQARFRQLSSPRSVAEIRLSYPEIEALTKWFGNVSDEVRRWMTDDVVRDGISASRQEMFGAVLLVVAAEICRERSREDYVWPDVRNALPELADLRRFLFPGGQPSSACKAAMRAAARRFQLRNVIDRAGTLEYFETVKLQFGFTWRGAQRRLAEWLVGLGTPEAVRFLRGQGEDLSLVSESFRLLWSTLQQYRKDLIGEGEARRVLDASPWVKPPWVDGILRQAKARLETLGRGEEDAAASKLRRAVTPDLPFRIALRWDGSAPRLEFRLDEERSIAAGIESHVLDFLVDNRRVGRWLHQKDSWSGPTAIPSPSFLPRALGVATPSGLAREFDLTETPLSDDVVLFDFLSGEMLHPLDPLDPNRDYALLCEGDLTLSGIQTPPWAKADSRRIYRLCCPWPETVRLMLDELIFWEPRIRHRAPPETIILALHTLPSRAIPLGSGSILYVSGAPPDTDEAHLIINGRSVPALKSDGCWKTAQPIQMSVSFALGLDRVRVKLRRGESLRAHHPKLSLQLTGLALLASGSAEIARPEWTLHRPGEALDISGGSGSGRVFCPGSKEVFVYEGPRLAARLRSGTLRFSDLHGWGLPVVAEGDEQTLLTAATQDQGCLKLYYPSMLGKRVQEISLRSPIEPGPDYKAIAWGAKITGPPLLSETTIVGSREEGFFWKLADLPALAALGISFQGTCLGAWWDERTIISLLTMQPSTETFAALRWFKIPVLLPVFRHHMKAAVCKAPVEFLQAWRTATGLPPNLQHREAETGIETVLRWFLWNLRERNPTRLQKILTIFEAPTDRPDSDRAFLTASRLCPTLAWALANHVKRGRKQAKRALVRLLSGMNLFQAMQPRAAIAAVAAECSRHTLIDVPELQRLTSEILTSLRRGTAVMENTDTQLRRIGETEIGRDYLCASILHEVMQD